VVVQDPDHPLLLSDAFDIEQMHWLNGGDAAVEPVKCSVKTRYRQGDLACDLRVSVHGQGHVTLREPARAVTPGQYAVFYRGARCLGGGVIARRYNGSAAPAARGIAYNSHFSVEGS
jgi:tRNA-specific 2-thiouridylase